MESIFIVTLKIDTMTSTVGKTDVIASFQTVEGIVLSRPSKVIKSPFVADVLIDGKSYLAHTPSLGCNGMVEKNKKVLLTRAESGKCDFTVVAVKMSELSNGNTEHDEVVEHIIGLDPRKAETFALDALNNGLIERLDVKEIKGQITLHDCRFDYVGTSKQGQAFVIEVKNVSIADHEVWPQRVLQSKDFTDRIWNHKIAYYPSNVKGANQTVSERSVKQLRTLCRIKRDHPEMRCIVMFVIQRTDIVQFQPNQWDAIYFQSVKEAHETGVEIYAISAEWSPSQSEHDTSVSATESIMNVRLLRRKIPVRIPLIAS